LRVRPARGRLQTGARRGSVGKHRRDAAASHRMVSCNARGGAWEPTAPRRPATGHGPGHWHGRGLADSYRPRASGDPLCRGRGKEPPLVFRLMVASDGRRRPCLPGSVPTGYASQPARGMVWVGRLRLLVWGSPGDTRHPGGVGSALVLLLRRRVAGVCCSPRAWPPGVCLPGIPPVPLSAGGGGSVGGCAAWVPHHFRSRCPVHWHRGWAWRGGGPHDTVTTGPARGVVGVRLASGMACCPGRGWA
jgi:hypothetical protein